MGNEGGEFSNCGFRTGGPCGGGPRYPPRITGFRRRKLQRFSIRPLSTDLDCFCGATKPRSLGWGTEKHRKGENGVGEFWNFGFRNGGRWIWGGRDTPRRKRASEGGSCKDFYSIRYQLTSIVCLARLNRDRWGGGAEKHRKVGNEGGEFLNCGFRNVGRRGGGPRYPIE